LDFTQTQGIQGYLGFTASDELLNGKVDFCFSALLFGVSFEGLGGFFDEFVIFRDEILSLVEVLELEEILLREIFKEIDVFSGLDV
jgi:hypothetical protein